MTDPLARQELIDLLERLGSDSDEDALDAARQVHARVIAAELSWDDLLAAEDPVATAEASDDKELEPTVEPTAPGGEDDADTLTLIEKMLAKSGISEEFREELEDYKSDIAKGEFEESDHRYIRALFERLS